MDRELERWKEAMVESVKKNYLNDGFLHAVAILRGEDKIYVVGCPFSNQTEKELCADALKQMVFQYKADAIIFAHEGYMASVPIHEKHKIINEDGTKIKPIKDVEGRKECIVIAFETKSGESEAIIIEIENQKLGKEERIKDKKNEGLFGNFFATPVWVN